MDLTKPVLVIDHEPRELQELADAGVDVDLCGHTHDGQLFPGNLLSGLMWENSCGYLQKDSMHNIVTSGVGVFGPDMRVGTNAEICDIRIHFAGDVPAPLFLISGRVIKSFIHWHVNMPWIWTFDPGILKIIVA